jgi:hypothetical protein
MDRANTMTKQSRYNNAERLGHWMGGRWRAYRKRERQTVAWALERGVPQAVAISSLWLVRLLIMGGLLYAAFWPGLLLAIAVMTAGAAAEKPTDSLTNDEKDEWRMGWSGYGLYRDDTRIDPGTDDEY